jgi:hypothetical protein
MSKTYQMGAGTLSKEPVTEKDPFTLLYDDGSYNVEHKFNTPEEAMDFVISRWKETTKVMRVSELLALMAEKESAV